MSRTSTHDLNDFKAEVLTAIGTVTERLETLTERLEARGVI